MFPSLFFKGNGHLMTPFTHGIGQPQSMSRSCALCCCFSAGMTPLSCGLWQVAQVVLPRSSRASIAANFSPFTDNCNRNFFLFRVLSLHNPLHFHDNQQKVNLQEKISIRADKLAPTSPLQNEKECLYKSRFLYHVLYFDENLLTCQIEPHIPSCKISLIQSLGRNRRYLLLSLL